MITTPAIKVAGPTKSHGDHSVLRGVELDVAPGTIFALLGSNGAGKTTAVKILSTLLQADDGTATSTGTTSPPRPRRCGSRSVSLGTLPATRSSLAARTASSSPSCRT